MKRKTDTTTISRTRREHKSPATPAAQYRGLLLTLALLLLPPAFALAQWPIALGGEAVTTPAIDGEGRIYLLAEDRYLYSFSPEGILRWRFDVDVMPAAVLALCPGGPAIIADRDGGATAISPGGTRIWRSQARAAPPGRTPGAAPGRVELLAPYCDREGFVHLLYSSGLISSISPAGNVMWETALGDTPVLPPISGAAGEIYVPTAGESVTVLGRDGSFRDRFSTSGQARAHAVVSGSYLLADAGGLLRYDLSGEVQRRELPAAPVRSILGGPGTFMLTETGELLVLPPGAAGEELTAGALRRYELPFGPGTELLFAEAAAGPEAAAEADPGGDGAPPAAALYLSGRSGIYRVTVPLPGGAEQLLPETVLTAFRGRSLSAAALGNGVVLTQSSEWILQARPLPETPTLEWSTRRGSPLRSGYNLERALPDAERSWRESFDYIYLESHLLSRSREDRLRAIRDLEERVERGTLRGSADYVVALLRRAVFQDFQGGVETLSGFADLRARVVRLLGKIGGRSAVGELTRLGRYSYSAEVDTAILRAFASVPAGAVEGGMDTIGRIVGRHAGRSGAGAVGRAAVSAIRALLAFGADTSRAADILGDIVRGAYPRDVREAALHILEDDVLDDE